MTPVGALPLAFEIEAGSLGQHREFAEWPPVRRTRGQGVAGNAQQQSSSIVIPEGIPGGFGGRADCGKDQVAVTGRHAIERKPT